MVLDRDGFSRPRFSRAMNLPTPHVEPAPEGDLRTSLLAALTVLCTLPYFSPIRLGIDTSPLYLLPAFGLCVLGIAVRRVVLSKGLWTVAIAWMAAGLFCVAKAHAEQDLGILRTAIGLIAQSLLIGAVGSTPLDRPGQAQRTLEVLATVIFWASLGWLAAALLQLGGSLLNIPAAANITSLLVSASRTTEGRGITALAAEPSFAGITCSLLAAFTWVLKSNDLIEEGKARIAIASFVAVAILSVSFVSFLSLALLGFFIARRATLTVSALLIALVCIFFLPVDAVQELRIVELFKALSSSPAIILADESAGMRAADILGRFLSIVTPGGLFGRFFEPSSATALQDSLNLIGGDAGGYLRYAADRSLRGTQPMSSLGSLIYEFGILGIALYTATIVVLWRLLRNSGIRGSSAVLVIATFGFAVQVPLSYPTAFTLPLILGLAARSRATQPPPSRWIPLAARS
jgi:hypothetical protein